MTLEEQLHLALIASNKAYANRVKAYEDWIKACADLDKAIIEARRIKELIRRGEQA